MKRKFCIVLALASGLVFSCGKTTKKTVPDVRNIKVDLQVHRFDQDLFALDTLHLREGLEQLENKYPEFSRVYFDQVLGAADPTIAPEGKEAYIRGFLSHPAIRNLYDTCQIVFGNFDPWKAELEQAFRYYKHYFPDRPIPSLTTCISEFSYAAFLLNDSSLAVSLEMFLGPGFPYSKIDPLNPAFSAYLTRTYTPAYLTLRVVQTLADDLVAPPRGNTLLDYMVHNAMKQCVIDALLPLAPDSIKWEFTEKQMKWVEDNERNIYAHLVTENLLYSTEKQKFIKLIDYSPNAPGMPAEAPGRTANYIGWKILESLRRQEPGLSLANLLNINDARAILQRSKYKPPR